MDCLLATGRALPCKDSVGGVQKIYFCDYGTLGALTISGGTLSAIGGTPDIFEYDVKDTSNLEQTVNSSSENGTTFYEQSITLGLHKLDAETQVELQTLIIGRPHAFVLDNNGNYLAVGLTRGCDVTGGTISTGTALGDTSGYSLTITGREPLMAMFTMKTVIQNNLDPTQIEP